MQFLRYREGYLMLLLNEANKVRQENFFINCIFPIPEIKIYIAIPYILIFFLIKYQRKY